MKRLLNFKKATATKKGPKAADILDRFLQRAQVITITGRSYRLKDRAASVTEKKDKTTKVALESTAGAAS